MAGLAELHVIVIGQLPNNFLTISGYKENYDCNFFKCQALHIILHITIKSQRIKYLLLLQCIVYRYIELHYEDILSRSLYRRIYIGTLIDPPDVLMFLISIFTHLKCCLWVKIIQICQIGSEILRIRNSALTKK